MTATPRSRWAPSFRLTDLPAAGIVPALSVAATVGFHTVFDSWGFVPASVIGALGASLLATRGARDEAEDACKGVAWSIAAFLFLGAVAVEGVPTPRSPAVFLEGLTLGWAQLLSVSPPVDLTPQLMVLPYTVAWAGAMVGIELYRLPRQIPALPAVGPVAAMTLASLLVFESPRATLAQGCAMVAGALLIGWIQQQRRSTPPVIDETQRPVRRTMAATTAVLTVVLVSAGALFLGPRLPFIDRQERFDLRQFQDPPFEPLLEPSPLAQLKASLLELNSDEVVFRVRSEQQINRWALAVMDDYTNEFWAVADEGDDPVGEFRPVDTRFPPLPEHERGGRERMTAEVEVLGLDQLSQGDYQPVWLVAPGTPVEVETEHHLDLRHNRSTGTTAVVPGGLTAGMSYRITADVPVAVDEAVLRQIATGAVERMELQPNARSYTADVVEGRDRGWEQVEAVVTALRNEGFYDARERQRTARPGHSISRLEEFVAEPAGLVGFEEQYAALATLMLRSQGVDSRVVVGWVIPPEDSDDRWAGGEVEVRAGDASAWIEVRFDGFGWVPFDVTPPRDRLQEQQDPEPPTFRDVATINPPPPPPESEVPPIQDQREVEDEPPDECAEAERLVQPPPPGCVETDTVIEWRTWAAGAALATPVVSLLGAIGVVLALKRRRVRRRREAAEPATRVAGAWYEVTDRLQEQGVGMPLGATPRAYVEGLRQSGNVTEDEHLRLDELATDLNAAAYHPQPPVPSVADRSWENADTVMASIRGRRPWRRRVVDWLDPRPLLRPDPIQRSGRQSPREPGRLKSVLIDLTDTGNRRLEPPDGRRGNRDREEVRSG